MKKAFVLISCDLGKERHPNCTTSYEPNKGGTSNVRAYDIVAEVNSDNAESLRETITLNIRKLPLRATLSLVATEVQS
ncbi:MAG: Lrp/AsnC family transcriptional regulator [Nitrosopumilus sp.]|nr:Lrp/AsnC family transcriptional regulator [Nitrosopumilus sp.]